MLKVHIFFLYDISGEGHNDKKTDLYLDTPNALIKYRLKGSVREKMKLGIGLGRKISDCDCC